MLLFKFTYSPKHIETRLAAVIGINSFSGQADQLRFLQRKKRRSEIVYPVACCKGFTEVVHYFENAICFQNARVNMVEFRSIKKTRSCPAPIFAKFTNSEYSNVQICYSEILPNRETNVESTDRYSFAAINKVRISLRVSRKSEIFDFVTCKFLISNFTQRTQEIWQLRVDVPLWRC
jgi:hypothetical protein